MDKSYFETRKKEIQSEIDSWKQKLKDLEDEYYLLVKSSLLGVKFVSLLLHIQKWCYPLVRKLHFQKRKDTLT